MKPIKSLSLGLLTVVFSISFVSVAHALPSDPTFTKGGTAVSGQGIVSSVPGVTTIDFNNGVMPANYSGGAIFGASISGVTAELPGDTTKFFSVGISGGQPSPATFLFANPLSYFGFYMGSPDTYNSVDYFSGGQKIYELSGAALAAMFPSVAPDGNQSVGFYVNAFASQGYGFDKIQFVSTQNAFETDNHAYRGVPEPATLLLLALGLICFVLDRNRKK